MCLLWELPVSNKPVKEALSPTRGMEHLDRLLIYHGLSYIDVFLFEIPPFEGGEVRSVATRENRLIDFLAVVVRSNRYRITARMCSRQFGRSLIDQSVAVKNSAPFCYHLVAIRMP